MFIKYVTTKTAAVHLSEYKTIPELFLIFSRPVLISDGITLRRHLTELKVASSSSSSCKCLGASCYFPRDSFLFPVPFSTEFCRGGNLKAFFAKSPIASTDNKQHLSEIQDEIKRIWVGFRPLEKWTIATCRSNFAAKKAAKKIQHLNFHPWIVLSIRWNTWYRLGKNKSWLKTISGVKLQLSMSNLLNKQRN